MKVVNDNLRNSFPEKSVGELDVIRRNFYRTPVSYTHLHAVRSRFGAATPKGPVAVGPVGVKTIAGGRSAMFVHTGPSDGLGGAYHKIFREWLPNPA